MAKPLELHPSTEHPRDEIQRRLADAPIEHAQALLACYKFIDQAHNSGALALLTALLAAQDTVITHASEMLAAPEAAIAICNSFVLIQMLGRIDPKKLSAVIDALSASASTAPAAPPPSIFKILGHAASSDARRALQLGVATLDAVGKILK